MNLDRPLAPDPYAGLPALPALALRSDDLSDGAPLPEQFSAAGGNVSPHLAWEPVDGVESWVVSCFDPDAPTPAGYWHWTVVDVPGSVTELTRGAGDPDAAALPDGAFQVRNDAGTVGYVGAAPPAGDREHRYVFAVHAVRVPSLGLDASATPTTVHFTALFQAIARGTLTATFRA